MIIENAVATVNGSPIDSKALMAAMRSLSQEHFRAPLAEVPVASRIELRAMALERLVARELIYQAALAQGIVADDAAVEEETMRILRMMGKPADFWARLAKRGMDEVSFLRMVRKDVTVDRMTARKLEELAEPSEEEIRQFYAEHPDQLRERERVRVSHILVLPDPEEPEQALQLAWDLKQQAEREGFAEIARRHSACASAPGGGELGFIRREEVDPDFADAAFSQIVGEVGAPVRTPLGYHLIKVTAHELPSPPRLEEARPRIIGFLKRRKGTQLLDRWVVELRRDAEIIMLDN
jgi:peptidyl-prolyl cis-trans isomerase C